ncbi:hypothetical protein DFAR_2150008 [Desulfarculales bacterium]
MQRLMRLLEMMRGSPTSLIIALQGQVVGVAFLRPAHHLPTLRRAAEIAYFITAQATPARVWAPPFFSAWSMARWPWASTPSWPASAPATTAADVSTTATASSRPSAFSRWNASTVRTSTWRGCRSGWPSATPTRAGAQNTLRQPRGNS